MPSQGRQVSKIAVRLAAKLALVCRIDCDRGAEEAAAPPATPRHPNHSLPLLPSGPGGVCELSSRGDRRGHHRRGLLSPETDGLDPLGTLQVGGESGIRTRDTYYRIHTFQACSFNHSDTSPLATNNNTVNMDARDCSAHPGASPLADARGPACGCPNLFQTNLSNQSRLLNHHRSTCIQLYVNPKIVARFHSLAERAGRTRDTYYRIHTFQACSFNHSDTSPHG